MFYMFSRTGTGTRDKLLICGFITQMPMKLNFFSNKSFPSMAKAPSSLLRTSRKSSLKFWIWKSELCRCKDLNVMFSQVVINGLAQAYCSWGVAVQADRVKLDGVGASIG